MVVQVRLHLYLSELPDRRVLAVEIFLHGDVVASSQRITEELRGVLPEL